MLDRATLNEEAHIQQNIWRQICDPLEILRQHQQLERGPDAFRVLENLRHANPGRDSRAQGIFPAGVEHPKPLAKSPTDLPKHEKPCRVIISKGLATNAAREFRLATSPVRPVPPGSKTALSSRPPPRFWSK